MRALKRLGRAAALLGSGFVLGAWITPSLWNHGSTGAFNAIIALWFVWAFCCVLALASD